MRIISLLLAIGGLIWGINIVASIPMIISHGELVRRSAISSMAKAIDEKGAQADGHIEIPLETARNVLRSALASRETIKSTRLTDVYSAFVILVLSVALFFAVRRKSPATNG